MGRKGKRISKENSVKIGEESSGDTDADDAFLIDDEDGDDYLPNTQLVDNRVLKDVVAYVEVRTKTENRSKGVSKQLELLGAKVEKKLTNEVTHIVWKDGKKSTRDRAIKKGIRLVSVLWVDSCKQNQEHVAESLFPVTAPDDKDLVLIGKLKRMKSMQPKEVEEDIQRSTGKGSRKRKARILHPSPAPLTINPAVLVAETQSMTPVTGDVPHTPSLIPDTPSSMKPCLDLLDSIKRKQGSAHRRVSITDSPNLSPNTPLRQRLFQCFTEEANSLTESPSTSVKLQKSGPVRRPLSRRNLADEVEAMEIEEGSTSVASGSVERTDAHGIEVLGASAEAGRRSRGSSRRSISATGANFMEIEDMTGNKTALQEAIGSRKGRRSSMVTPSLKHAEDKDVKQSTGASIEAVTSRKRGRRSNATPDTNVADLEESKDITAALLENVSSRKKGRRSVATPSMTLAIAEELDGSTKHLQVATGRREKGRRSIATPTATTLADVPDVDALTISTKNARNNRGKEKSRKDTPKNQKFDVGHEDSWLGEGNKKTLVNKSSSNQGYDSEQDFKKEGRSRDNSSIHQLSLDCESSTSQESSLAGPKNNSHSVTEDKLDTTRKRRSRSKTSNETISGINDNGSMSDTSDIIIVSTSPGKNVQKSQSSQEKPSSKDDTKSRKSGATRLKRKKNVVQAVSEPSESVNENNVSDNSDVAMISTSSCDVSERKKVKSTELKEDNRIKPAGPTSAKRNKLPGRNVSINGTCISAEMRGLLETSNVESTSTLPNRTGSSKKSNMERKPTMSRGVNKNGLDAPKDSERKDMKSSNDVMNSVSVESMGLLDTNDNKTSSMNTVRTSSQQQFSQEKKYTKSKENSKGKADALVDPKKKKSVSSKQILDNFPGDMKGLLETNDTSRISASTTDTGSTRSSTRRRSCLPGCPAKSSPADTSSDQTPRRNTRRKSAIPLPGASSLADHLNPVGIRPKKVGVLEEGKIGEKENQSAEDASPMALGQRIGSLKENEDKRKLLSPLPSDMTCSSILSSTDVENRQSIEDFRQGSSRQKLKRPALKKKQAEILCTSSEESAVSSDDLDNTHKNENKSSQIGTKETRAKKRKKVTMMDKLPTNKRKKSTIVMTSLHRSDQEIVMAVVKDLGRFAVTDTVCETTTHVVIGENRRTLNVLSGIARGCWIVSMNWVYCSVEAGAWLPEEPFEMNIYFPGAMISRLAHGAKPDPDSSAVDIFSSCDALYVPPESNPPRERLVELIELCGGHVSRRVLDAKLCVGGSSRGKRGSIPVVAERWILDCVTRFKLLPWDTYQMDKS